MKRVLAALALTLAAIPAGAQVPRQEVLQFSERSPLGAPKVQDERIGARTARGADYVLAEESFHVYYPKKFKPKKPYGVLVWISPGKTGMLPPFWQKTLDKAKLIGIGADRAGNARKTGGRVGLALDAVHNLTARHVIDADRIYVIGFSSGADVASRLTWHYPEVFTGGIYMGGGLYHTQVNVSDQPGRKWAGGIAPPPEERLALVRKNRHVWLAGADDRVPFQLSQDLPQHAREQEGFLHVTGIVVPKLGHDLADGKWLKKALAYLDDPPPPADPPPPPKAPTSRPAEGS